MPNKAVAAGGSAAIAGAIVTLILSLFSHPVSPDVAGSLNTLVTALVSAVATYYTRSEQPGGPKA